MGHHGGPGPTKEQAGEVAEVICRAAAKPTRRRLRKLYEAVNTDDVLGLVDPVVEALVAKRPPSEALAQIGAWLASTSPDRGPTKVGIALLGVTGATDGALLHDLGAHELLSAAGDIIDALIMGGPAEDIDDYPAAPEVLARWLDHMDNRAETLSDFITVRTIRDFCDRNDWDRRLTGVPGLLKGVTPSATTLLHFSY